MIMLNVPKLSRILERAIFYKRRPIHVGLFNTNIYLTLKKVWMTTIGVLHPGNQDCHQ